jgi:hypothetical protein
MRPRYLSHVAYSTRSQAGRDMSHTLQRRFAVFTMTSFSAPPGCAKSPVAVAGATCSTHRNDECMP